MLKKNFYQTNFIGKDINDMQSTNIKLSLTLLLFHSDISAIDINDEQLENIPFILLTLLEFHLDISVMILKTNN